MKINKRKFRKWYRALTPDTLALIEGVCMVGGCLIAASIFVFWFINL